MDWETILNWFHNNTAEWIALAVSIGVGIFSIYQFFDNRSKSTKIESARLIMELDKKLDKEVYMHISARIGDDIDKKEVFTIKDIQDRDNVLNYLNELETISSFYLEKILTKKQTYELLGHQIISSLMVETINKLIDEIRTADNKQDLFFNLEKTCKDMKEYNAKINNKPMKKIYKN
jgi:hypothetical protein